MPKELYLLDTINAVRNYDEAMNSYLVSPYHSYNVLFPFKFPILHLKSITLKSVEMPITLFTVRSKTGIFKITFTYGAFNNVTIIINIINKQYSDIASLLSAINNTVTNLLIPYTGVSINFQTIQSLYLKDVCNIVHNCVSITIENTPLTFDILGYTNRFSAVNSVGLISNSPINFNGIDTCLYMNISNLPIMNNNTPSYYTFKIPLNSSNITNNILHYNDAYENQTIYFNESNFVLDKLNVVVYDRYGGQLIGYNNWSFTLIIDYDDTIGQNQIEFLNIYN